MDKIVAGTLIGWEIEAGYPKDIGFMRAAMETRNPAFVEGVVKELGDRFYFHENILRKYLVACGVKVSKVYSDGWFEGVCCWEVATAPLPYGEEAFSNLELLLDILRELGCVSGPATSAHTNVSVPLMREWHRDEFAHSGYPHSGVKRGYVMAKAFLPECWKNFDICGSHYGLLSFMVGSRLDDVGLNKMFMRGGVRKVTGSNGFVSRTVLGRVDNKLIISACGSMMIKHDYRPGTARIEVRQPGGVRVLGGKPERSMQLLRKAAEMSAVAVNEGWNDYVELVDEGSSDERVKEICVQAVDRIEKMADAHMGSPMRWAYCNAEMVNGKVKYSINRYNFYMGKSMRVVGRKVKVGFWDQSYGREYSRDNEKFFGVLVKGKTFRDVVAEADKVRKARAVRPSRSRKKVAA